MSNDELREVLERIDEILTLESDEEIAQKLRALRDAIVLYNPQEEETR